MSAPSGTLIAAALETAGYHTQQQVIDQLGQMFNQLGMLLYLAVMIIALIVVVSGDEYRKVIWLFIGPALFYFLVFYRVPADGAEWQFGNFSDRADGNNELANVIGPAKKANVSWFFNKYNHFISEVYRQLIVVITSSDSLRKQVRFMTHARITEGLTTADIGDPELQAFIANGIAAECSGATDALRKVMAGFRRYGTAAYGEFGAEILAHDPDFMEASSSINDLYYGELHAFPTNSPQKTYLTRLLKNISEMSEPDRTQRFTGFCNSSMVSPADDRVEGNSYHSSIRHLQNDFNNNSAEELADKPFNCFQLWCWTAVGISREVDKIIETEECENLPSLVNSCYGGNNKYRDIVREMWKEIEVKLAPKNLTDADETNLKNLPLIMTGMLLRKALLNENNSAMIGQFAENSGYYTESYVFRPGAMDEGALVDFTRRANQHRQSAYGRYELFTFASLAPQMQGVIIFCLCVTYPFFGFLLLIPDKANSFFMFIGLWSWVKCWDVGFACVMVVDDLLWSLMPHYSKVNIDDDVEMGPLTYLEGAFYNDPGYSLTVYYMILSSMIFGVIIFSARAIIGTKAALAGTVLDSFRDLSTKMGGAFADAEGTDQTFAMDRMNELTAVGLYMAGDGKPASEESARLKEGNEAMLATAEKYRTASSTAAYGGLAGLAGSLMFKRAKWIRGVTAVASGAIGMGGVLAYEKSTDVARATNKLEANRISLDGSLRHAMTNNHMAIIQGKFLKAAVSGRGEHFVSANPAYQAAASIVQMDEVNDLLNNRGFSSFFGDFIGGARGR